jgi:putative ABC transport system permease protein
LDWDSPLRAFDCSSLQPARLPRLDEIALDPLVIGFTFALSVLAGLLFGLIPVAKYARPHLAHALKEGSRGSSDGRERHRARNMLVVAQVALAIVLLVGSGLMIRTFLAIRDVPPGFVRPDDVLTMRLTIPRALISDATQVALAHEQIVRRLEAIPGVESVGVSSSITMDGLSSNDPIFVEDFPRPEGSVPPLRRFKWIGPHYFETMGNPVIAGRAISWNDVHNVAPVAMVGENFAREFWGDPAKAVGRRIRRSPKAEWKEIIGVVGIERQDGITQPTPTIIYWPMLIRDLADTPPYVQSGLGYAIRSPRLHSNGFMEEVQQAVWSVNSNLPLARVQTLRELYDSSMAQTSFMLVILAIAASVTLILGIVGIYGVIAYVVSQRQREIGIRMALGARARDVQNMFVGRGLALTAVGLILGVAVAGAVMRLLGTLLYNVSPFDPVTYGAASVALGVVALVATWLPARQATRVDPAIGLRSE